MTAAAQTTGANPTQALYASLNGAARDADAQNMTGQEGRFLKLMIAQLKNQDPLNPLDNSQMTSQMAQISTVDGIERLNATLKMILDGSGENQALQAAALVGHNVLVPGSGLVRAGGVAVGGIELAEPADRVTVTIKDAGGNTVRTLELGGKAAGSHGFAWDGLTNAGSQAADGAYTVSASARRGEASVAATALQLGVVSSVTRTSQGVSLNVGALGVFSMSDIRQIM